METTTDNETVQQHMRAGKDLPRGEFHVTETVVLRKDAPLA